MMRRSITHLILALGLSIGITFTTLALLSVPIKAADQCVAPGGGGGCFATIQAAINAVGSGQTVRVVVGTYNERLVINKSLTLLGGFNDTTLTGRTPRSSIINGGGTGSVISITNNAAVTIDGFTITGGNGTTNGGVGGGIAIRQATATIRDNLIENNVASSNQNTDGRGGGIYIVNSTSPVLIENNTIRANVAYSVASGSLSGGGGGIAVYTASSAIIIGNQIVSNTGARNSAPLAGSQGFGGGVKTEGISVSLENNVIQGNIGANRSEGGYGGGIDAFRTPAVTLTNNLIMQNTANLSGSMTAGGGVLIGVDSGAGHKFTLTGNQIISNTAGLTITGANPFAIGGGVAVFGGGANNDTLIVQDNHLVGNVAVQQMTASVNGSADGGGLSLNDISNANISDNNILDNITAYTLTISGGAVGNGGGGGVSSIRNNMLLQGNIISNNIAHRAADGGSSGTLGESFGAGVNIQEGTANLSSNLIVGNRRNAAYAPGGNSGVWAWQSTLTSTNDIIARNFDGIGAGNQTTMVLYNDTLYNNGDIGVSSFLNSTVLVINTIVYSHQQGLLENGSGTTLIGNYNLATNIENYAGGASGNPANDIIDQNPLLRAPLNDDFHLNSGSPAIDAGVSAGAPAMDFEGDSRPQLSGIDIGADEFSLQKTYLPILRK
ncbi:MAG: choice-of-anchor Q domain-containing protein [Anaerolineae bacterium]